jgi:hypothetical protein
MAHDYPINVGSPATGETERLPGTCNKCGELVAIVAHNERRCADIVAAQAFHQIKKFAAACRRQWPGAMIVLRPDGAPTGASAPTNLKPAPGADP